jgi:hypothetical protein
VTKRGACPKLSQVVWEMVAAVTVFCCTRARTSGMCYCGVAIAIDVFFFARAAYVLCFKYLTDTADTVRCW